MIAILFFIFALFLGFVFVYSLKINLFLEEKIAWSVVLGTLVLTMFSFVFFLLFGFTPFFIFIDLFLFFLFGFLLFFIKRKEIKKEVIRDINFFKKRFLKGELTTFFIVFIIFLLFFTFVWSRVFFETKEGYFTLAVAGIWGDWAAHNTYVSHFAFKDRISLENPIFAGERFTYTFIADFLSAFLIKLGEDRVKAMVIPGFVFSIALVILLYYFVFRLTNKRGVSALSIFLYFFGGGLGFVYFLKEVDGMTISEIINFLKNSYAAFTHIVPEEIRWTNFIQALLLPQRAFNMGFPIAILVLTSVYLGLKREKERTKLLFLGGAVSSLLPTIHIHSLVAVSVIVFFMIIFLSEKRNILKNSFIFFLPIIIIALWQVFYFFPAGGKNFKFHFGWMARKQNWFLFWFKNLGAFFVLAPVAFFFVKKELRLIYLSFCSLFLLHNFFLFQPHDYDNIKIATFWFLLTVVIVSNLLIKLWKKEALFKILVVFLVFSMTFSFFIDFIHLYTKKYLLISREDIEKAEIIRKVTSSDAVFLTSDEHNHYLPCLTGRTIVAGYGGWLWTYGIDAGERFRDISFIYEGKKEAKDLLKKYKINYVLIGKSERNKQKVNEEFFEKNFPLFLKINEAKIYKIN